jgi:DUF4097 and DUF4098 domain-containing protein YvlB
VEDREREGLNRAEQLAARARELAERAEQVSRQAADAAESEETLAQLERDLADLDEEERRLDEEFTSLLAEGDTAERDNTHRGERREDSMSGWADRLSERMESIGARITEAVTSALAATPFGVSDKVERDVTVDGPLPVSVDSFAGKITVRAGDGNRVHVVAERHGWTDADRDAIVVDVDRDEQGVHVRARTASTHGHRWVSLEVEVPTASPLTISTLGGAIRVERVGGPVTATTRGGSIRVDGAVGLASLDTLGGSIMLGEHRGPVRVRTKGGSLKLTGALTGDVDAETMGGSVRIEGVDGTVRAQTMGGSVHVSGRFSGECSLSTVGGSVSVGLAAGSNVKVDATGSSSSTDVPGLQATRGRIDGTVGDGSDGSLTLRTSGGSVRVHTI